MEVEPQVKKQADRLFNHAVKNMADTLGIRFKVLNSDLIVATMPVDERTVQPFGLLHGGASASLAETLASVGGWLNLKEPDLGVVGIEINANHLRSKRSGMVTGRATPIRIGSTIHVWEIRIEDEEERLICISRCTLAVIKIRNDIRK
ncbi:MAG TPA: hotdog fold thioesterase [Balneolales bacterium]|nr:hotdog fold thioesterase [Balneolales bacterium]